MKTVYKICLIHVAVAVAIALVLSTSATSADAFIGFLGLISLLLTPVALLVLLGFKKTVAAQGFLLSAGVLLLLGFALCSVVA